VTASPRLPELPGPPCRTDVLCEDCGYDLATGQLPHPPRSSTRSRRVLAHPGPARSPLATRHPSTGVGRVPRCGWTDWFAPQPGRGSLPTAGDPYRRPAQGHRAADRTRSSSRNINPEIDAAGDGAIFFFFFLAPERRVSLAAGQWSVKDRIDERATTSATGTSRRSAARTSNGASCRRRADLPGAGTRVVVASTDAEKAAY